MLRFNLRWARQVLRVGDERGIALVMALGIMFVMAIVAVAALQYTTSNSSSSTHSNASTKAFGLSEAGLSTARSVLFSSTDPMAPGAVGSGSQSLDGGTSSYSGTLSGSTWTLTGTGTVPNPSGTGTAARTASEQLTISTQDTAWQYLFSDSTSGCMSIKNNAAIAAPLYTRGNLCLGNNSQLNGSPLQVLGTLTLGSGSQVGSPGTPIAEAHLQGGCITGGAPHTCTAADKVYANILDSTTDVITKPSVDLPKWYAQAAPGPSRPCTTGSVPGGFDTDGTMNRSRPTFTLGSGPAFDCRVTDGSGNLIGRLSWTPGSPGTLTVAGTIFFDGNLALTSLVYQGRATIYSSGIITMDSASFCGVAACDATWNPNVNAILLVAGSSTDPIGFDIINNSVYQGAAFVVTGYSLKNNNTNWGPVVANDIDIKNNSAAFTPMSFLPPGAPGIDGTIHGSPGSWRG